MSFWVFGVIWGIWVFWVFGYLDIWVFGFMGIWGIRGIRGILGIWVFEYFGNLVIGYLGICIIGYFVFVFYILYFLDGYSYNLFFLKFSCPWCLHWNSLRHAPLLLNVFRSCIRYTSICIFLSWRLAIMCYVIKLSSPGIELFTKNFSLG